MKTVKTFSKFKLRGNKHSQEYANKEYILRERPKFMGYPGRFYRQWEVTFFPAKKGGADFSQAEK